MFKIGLILLAFIGLVGTTTHYAFASETSVVPLCDTPPPSGGDNSNSNGNGNSNDMPSTGGDTTTSPGSVGPSTPSTGPGNAGSSGGGGSDWHAGSPISSYLENKALPTYHERPGVTDFYGDPGWHYHSMRGSHSPWYGFWCNSHDCHVGKAERESWLRIQLSNDQIQHKDDPREEMPFDHFFLK